LGVDRVVAFLRRHRRIALDTSVFIYQLEGNPRYLPFTDPVFSWLEQPESKAVTSTITMTELLVRPYRSLGEQEADMSVSGSRCASYPNLDPGGRGPGKLRTVRGAACAQRDHR
jgi:hypothetical protein